MKIRFLLFLALEKSSFLPMIKSIKMKWWGQKLVLPNHPCAFLMVPYYLFGSHRIFGGATVAGGETPLER